MGRQVLEWEELAESPRDWEDWEQRVFFLLPDDFLDLYLSLRKEGNP